MQVMGASNGLPTGQWAVLLRSISHAFGKQFDVNNQTVTNIGFINQGQGKYNYVAGAQGMFVGGALFGPLGVVVGGLLPKGFKGQLVEFAIELSDGAILRAKGSPREYEQLVKWSMEDPGAGLMGKLQASGDRAKAELDKRESIRGLATDADRDRIRATLAAEKAAKKSPEAKAERKARVKAVREQKLPMRETLRLIQEIEAEYR
jgi:hypothetical protein